MNVNEYCLLIKWSYLYNKESTWFDEDSGEERFDLIENREFALPRISTKTLKINSVQVLEGNLQAEIYVDYQTFSLVYGAPPVAKTVSYDYCVCGDCVSQTLHISCSILKKDN